MITLVTIAAHAERWIPRFIKFGGARLIGMVVYWLNPRVRQNTNSNMAVVLDLPRTSPQVRRLAMESVIAYTEHLVDFLRSYRMNTDELLRQTTFVDGFKHYIEFQNRSRGGILITAHFGNWEVSGGLVSLDNRTYAVAETFGSRSVNAFLRNVRARKNIQSIQVGNAGRELLDTLKRGGITALLGDRPTPGKGPKVDFFGRPAQIPDSAARLAVRTNSPVLVGGVVRKTDGTYTVHVMPVIYPNSDRPTKEAVAETMQRIMWDIESLIRKAPQQWYMFRQMWPEAGKA